MPSKMRLDASLVAGLAAFAGVADAFWRLPCQGRSGLARMDPLMDPGEPSYHVHTVHGSNGWFNLSTLLRSHAKFRPFRVFHGCGQVDPASGKLHIVRRQTGQVGLLGPLPVLH